MWQLFQCVAREKRTIRSCFARLVFYSKLVRYCLQPFHVQFVSWSDHADLPTPQHRLLQHEIFQKVVLFALLSNCFQDLFSRHCGASCCTQNETQNFFKLWAISQISVDCFAAIFWLPLRLKEFTLASFLRRCVLNTSKTYNFLTQTYTISRYQPQKLC